MGAEWVMVVVVRVGAGAHVGGCSGCAQCQCLPEVGMDGMGTVKSVTTLRWGSAFALWAYGPMGYGICADAWPPVAAGVAQALRDFSLAGRGCCI